MRTVVLNIGNTHVEMGIRDGDCWTERKIFDTAAFSVADLPTGLPVRAATVVPVLREKLSTHGDIQFLTADRPGLPVDFSQLDTSTTGADRVANALALAADFPLPGLVLDCGTAITIEVVDRDGVFRGGAIAPGRRLMRHALFSGTAQLPEIALSKEVPGKIGVDTVSSIAFGIDAGVVGMVRELVARAAEQYSCASLVGTGGDIDFFLPHLAGMVKAADDFTLRGVLAAFRTSDQSSTR